MKVNLEPSNRWGKQMFSFNQHIGVIELTRSLPFYLSKYSDRAHRIRSGIICVWKGESTHLAFQMWCGTGACIPKHGQLVETLSRETPVCATCEGRAIGAGQIGSREINGQAVTFTPRRPARLRGYRNAIPREVQDVERRD